MSLRKLNRRRAGALFVCGVCLVTAAPVWAGSAFVSSLDSMMVALAAGSARSGLTIRQAYHEHLDLLMLAGYTDMEGALDNGGLVPLPEDPARFNLLPRLDGPHPIGEKDIANQSNYIAARPATVGMLIDIARRVKSGPLEITSLVRHGEYQDALRTTNVNANTSVPMHTMGLAVDIALVNSSLETAHEVRDVLLAMQQRGDILFVGERRQLVFHVVPHPARLGHFTDIYIRQVGMPPTSQSALVFAKAPASKGRKAAPKGVPTVTTEVIAVQPLDLSPASARHSTTDTATAAAASGTAIATVAATAGATLQRVAILLAALLLASWRFVVRRQMCPGVVDLRS